MTLSRRSLAALALLGPALPAAARAEAAGERGDAKAAAHWITAHAARITTFNPEAPDADLEPFDRMTAGVRIAGFGEATHGAREFFRLKHRIFRRLARHGGFTAFAIEGNYAAGAAINAYVHGGPGDAAALVDQFGWTWNTEEVLALVRWMRAYNEGRSRKLSVYGFDIQFAPANLAIAFDYLEAAGRADAPRRADFAAYLCAATNIAAGYRATNGYSDAEMTAIRRRAEALFQYFDAHRAELVAAGGEAAYLKARAAALAGAWYFLMQARPADWRLRGFHNEFDVRDRAMADLAQAALGMEGPDGKVFLWAHDAHISRQRAMDERFTMGRYLSEDLGEAYLGVGFAFDRGGFQAFPPADPAHPEQRSTLTEFQVPPAPDGFSEAVLRRGPAPAYVVDLRRLDRGTPAYRWFQARRPLRWTGALFAPALMARHPPISLADSYDAMVFVQQTTRARPTEGSREKLGIPRTW